MRIRLRVVRHGGGGGYRSSGRPNGRTGLAPLYSRLVAYVNVVRPGREQTLISSSRKPLRRRHRRRCRVVVVIGRLVGGARFTTTLTTPTRYQRTIRSIDGGLNVQLVTAVVGEGEQCPSSVQDSVSQLPSSQPTIHKTL